jgi:hypothetical protein
MMAQSSQKVLLSDPMVRPFAPPIRFAEWLDTDTGRVQRRVVPSDISADALKKLTQQGCVGKQYLIPDEEKAAA